VAEQVPEPMRENIGDSGAVAVFIFY